MQEKFLHYIWQFQYFNKKALKTSDGRMIKVFAPGMPNLDSGPDFFQARMSIDGIEWVGNVEIHIKASDWYDHRHDRDAAYGNVILHVVWEWDKLILQEDGTIMPTLELRDRVKNSLIGHYRDLMENPSSIPCEQSFLRVHRLVRLSMLNKAAVQRLESKAERVTQLLKNHRQDWEEITYQLIAQNFGFKTNQEPFFQLARSLPRKFLLKQGNRLIQIEALLFGQAGFLEGDLNDNYFKLLQREYAVLSHKYLLRDHKMNKSVWKFMRLRPANFPTLRIAQFAALLFKNSTLFSQLMEAETNKQIRVLFELAPSDYWRNHYRFGRKTNRLLSKLGTRSIDNLIINTVAPLLVAYAKFHDQQNLVDRALHLLEHTPTEQNHITRKWTKIGFIPRSALDSQGLIELNNNFCLKRKCLSCSIGINILKPKS